MDCWKRVAATALLALPAIAQAADMTAFGFTLGSRLTVPECQRVSGSYAPPSDQPCFELVTGNRYHWIKFPVRDRPRLAFLGTVVGTVVDGNLEGIHFQTMGLRNADAIIDELTRKYGAPSKTEMLRVQTTDGGTFEAPFITWDLGELRVLFEGIDGRVDRGLVFIQTPKGRAAFEAHRQQITRDRRPL